MAKIVETRESSRTRLLQLWLWAVAGLVFVMVVVGGATRLTESGLSITEWKPVTGIVPPLDEAAWTSEFAKYQKIPQYRQLNRDMTLAEFKTIYWWEWTHRLLGRLIGVAFLLPFLWFLWRGFVPEGMQPRLWSIFALGLVQGGVGWWMVASGLADRVEVSHERLAVHLILACLIYVALISTARRLSTHPPVAVSAGVRASAIGMLALVLVQIYLGALVAGLRAGYIYNTWPLIDGAFIPSRASLFFLSPPWRNVFDNALTVQFDHRMLAYAIAVAASLFALAVRRNNRLRALRPAAFAVLATVAVQIVLGIATLLWQVPLLLALLHQAMAMVTLTAVTLLATDTAIGVAAVAREAGAKSSSLANAAGLDRGRR